MSLYLELNDVRPNMSPEDPHKGLMGFYLIYRVKMTPFLIVISFFGNVLLSLLVSEIETWGILSLGSHSR